MVNPVQCSNNALTTTIDLEINVTKEQVVSTTDLSVPILVVSTGPFSQGDDRVQFYTSLDDVEEDFSSTSEAYKGARDFFAQNPRPYQMAIGQAFDTPQAGFMVTGATGSVANFALVSDGAFAITIDGVTEEITGLDFSLDTTFDEIAATIQTALNAIGTGGYTAATVVASNEVENQFTITSGVTGNGSTVSVLQAPMSGTDVSGINFMNGLTGTVVSGYTPTTFTNELNLIKQAAACAGQFVYGWCLSEVYRDTQSQLDAAAWAEGQDDIILAATTNNILSYDSANILNNGYLIFEAGYTKTFTFFHDDPDYYPGMALLAIALSVDYAQANSSMTLKFKNLNGIPTVQFAGVTPEEAVDVLNSRRINTFTLMTNTARTTREGVMASEEWYIDERTNVDNFTNELDTAVYNVFISTPKVPYTTAGETLIANAETQICQNYVRNGVLAARPVVDTTVPSGVRTLPPYQIIFQPLQNVTAAERAQRILPGNTIILELADAIHKIIINVTVRS